MDGYGHWEKNYKYPYKSTIRKCHVVICIFNSVNNNLESDSIIETWQNEKRILITSEQIALMPRFFLAQARQTFTYKCRKYIIYRYTSFFSFGVT